jgi:hypothetical protein
LVSAAVVFAGPLGAVTALARQRGVSRQRLYREAPGVVRALDDSAPDEELADLRRQVSAFEARCAQLRQQLAAAFVADAAKQALGVSLTAAQRLLAVLLGAAALSRAELGRRARAAGDRAGAVLAALDRYSRGRARQVAADAIFSGRKPILMTVEPDSLCWLGGRLADNRDGGTGAAELRALPAAEQVTADGGQGLRKGVALVNDERRKAGAPPLRDQRDHFHILPRGRRGRRGARHQARLALQRAEQAQAV